MRNYKELFILCGFIFALLVLSFFVYAAGSSEIPQRTPTPTSEESRDVPQTEEKDVDCESFTERSARIRCRLQNRVEDDLEIDYEKRVPEACRNLENPAACIALYKKVRNMGCYALKGREKDRCFKESAEIMSARLSELSPEERAEKIRKYLIFLLYEVEERIENANKNGKITDDKAAKLIDLTVEIKEDILNGKRKAEIIPKLRDLRNKLREVRSGEETE